MAAQRRLILQVDGTPGSPPRGVAGLGVVLRGPRGEILTSRCLCAPAQTNNEAEYQALIAGLALLLRHYPQAAARCLTDSQIVVEQLAGRSAVRAESLRPLHTQAAQLLAQLPGARLVLIPRELNRLADALAWEALGGRGWLMRAGAE